jgi:drug/metabolite transporter (DMT)-like permease
MNLKVNSEIEEDIDGNLLKDQNTKIDNKKSKCSGLLYALLAPLCFAMCNSLIRKCNILNFSEIALIRFIVQFIVIIPINIKYKRSGKEYRAKLSIRSIFNVCSIMFFYFSIQLINPSDATALFNCCVIFITLFARIFLKELLTVVHIMVLIITIVGIFLISQPEFFFGKITNSYSNSSLLINSSFSKRPFIKNVHNDYMKLFGVGFALLASFAYTIVALITKKLANLNCDISIICAYFVYFGLPTTFLTSLILILTGVEQTSRFSFSNDYALAWDIFFASVSAFFGFLGQVLMNMAMQKEDANKVSLLDATGLIYNFLFQYIMLGIISNYLSALGALLIFTGTIIVMSYRILDKKHEKIVQTLKINKKSKSWSEGLIDKFFYKF